MFTINFALPLLLPLRVWVEYFCTATSLYPFFMSVRSLHLFYSLRCSNLVPWTDPNYWIDSRLESYENINRNVSLTVSKIRISNFRSSTNFPIKHFQPQSAFTAENWSTIYSCFKDPFHCITIRCWTYGKACQTESKCRCFESVFIKFWLYFGSKLSQFL